MKVFLVDDEKNIVDGLQAILASYVPECEIIGSANNGLEGYAQIRQSNPDIIITDICMPKADGLEMIHMLQEEGCTAKFILLSGYAEFEYARKGIQLGVQYFLNKPVEEEELQKCLRQVMEKLQAEQAKLKELASLKVEVNTRMVQSALRDLIDAGLDNKIHVDELLRITGIPLENSRYISAVAEIHSGAGRLGDAELEAVFSLIELALEPYQKVYQVRYSSSQIAVVIVHNGDIRYPELQYAFQGLREEASHKLNCIMTIGIGAMKRNAGEIGASFEEACHALSYKVLKGTNSIIMYSEMLNLSGKRYLIPVETLNELESSLEQMDEESCIQLIRGLLREVAVDPGNNLADLQSLCLQILLVSVRKMSFEQVQNHDILGNHILALEGISRFRTMESLEDWMIQVIRGIIAFKQEHNLSLKKDVIAEVKSFVAKHYDEPISLAELSSRFYINSYYLSQLFKQKTGDTYLNYLAKIRIGKAKELLEKTNYKVYEICKMVGYSDTQHFTRLFEKLAGVKPSEYRKKFSQ
ncbi:response regulator [Paenibacillus sp. MMS20-IR301]|uniref:response regulator transcription factor n=1 Tax=Paenibacillus sp. MMS20-IR301 TaxID=2895946 RepID=UPI0028E260F2|nr:response regulator [Paenibacillus sp. MMS20-IR301]WNS40779.1 response regulator [Paenibacillus sp. MMS20-IR301]